MSLRALRALHPTLGRFPIGLALASLLLAGSVFRAPLPVDAQVSKMPLVSFYNSAATDYYTTTQLGIIPSGYSRLGTEGYVFSPTATPPSGTVALYQWLNQQIGDYFLTSDPAWAGGKGDVRGTGASHYSFVRIEGYVYPDDPDFSAPLHSLPLRSAWNGTLQDNGASAGAIRCSGFPAGYTVYRLEGFVFTADLRPTSLTVESVTPDPDPNYARLSVRLTVVNEGEAPANPFRGEFRYRTATQTQDAYAASVQLTPGPMVAGSTITYSGSVRVPRTATRLIAEVDPVWNDFQCAWGDVLEQNESDDTITAALALR
jgi:hypothetical protein